MKIILYLSIFVSSFVCHSQSKINARNFIDFQPFYGISNPNNPSFSGRGLFWDLYKYDQLVGARMRLGRNWYVGKYEKFKTILQVSWFESGNHNYGYLFNPLQVGLGKKLIFSENHSIETLINGGIQFNTDDYLAPSIEVGFGCNLELKYVFKNGKFGFYWQPYATTSYQYIALNIGLNL